MAITQPPIMVVAFRVVCIIVGLWMVLADLEAAGTAPTYTKTRDIGACARTCAKEQTCLYIVYGGIPNVTAERLCGRQFSTVRAVNNTSAYIKENRVKINSSGIECASFIYVPTGSSRSLKTPLSLTPGTLCRLLLVGEENSTLFLSAELLCPGSCSSSDLLRLRNVWVDGSQSKAASACLDASDNQSELVVLSATGAYISLEFDTYQGSGASYNVTVSSFDKGPQDIANTSSLPVLSQLVKGGNSAPPQDECYWPQDHVFHYIGAGVKPAPVVTSVDDLTSKTSDTPTPSPASGTQTPSPASDTQTPSSTADNRDHNIQLTNSKENYDSNSSTLLDNHSSNGIANNNSQTKTIRNPAHTSTTSQTQELQSAERVNPTIIAGGVVGGAAACLVVTLGITLLYRKYHGNKVKPVHL